ncbi:MAG: hypothetical protein M4D80_18735 [Myxococcota bacterium]|nr:hypothetical protein [Myxococcota bacterium]
MRTALVFVASTLYSVTAAAQSTSWHGTLSGDVAVTDNVYARPGYSLTNRDGDLFFQLRPGFLVSRNAPRAINSFLAEAEIIHYAFNSRYPSVSGRAGWNGFYLPGPRSEVILSVNGSTGILTALQSRLSSDETMININPVGKVTFQQADASEYFSYILTRELRFSQTLFARINATNDNAEDMDESLMNTTTNSSEAGLAMAIERSFEMSSISFETGASVSRLERKAPRGLGIGMGPRLDRQVSPRARLQYRRDLDRRLSLGADGGVVYVWPFGKDPYNPDEERKPGYFPIAGAQFSMTDVWGRGTLAVRRDVTPNLQIAQQTVNDSVSIGAAIPLPWLDDTRRRAPKLIGLASLGLQRTRLIDSESSDTTSSINAARIDVAVIYVPRPGVTYGLRYEGQFQTGDDEAELMVPGFYRNTIYFNFSMRYPNEVAGTVPKRRANNPTRADRKDQSPIGAEPVVPDLLEDGGGEGEGDER